MLSEVDQYRATSRFPGKKLDWLTPLSSHTDVAEHDFWAGNVVIAAGEVSSRILLRLILNKITLNS